MRIKRIACVMIVFAMVFIMAPLPVYAAFSFDVMPTYENMKVGSEVQLVMWPAANTTISYSCESLTKNIATVDKKTDGYWYIKGIKEGTAYIGITGTSGAGAAAETITKLLTVAIGKGSGSSTLGPNEKKLTISSATSLDKKIGDPAFTFSVTFNIPKKEVDYTFEIDDEEIATIDEDSGLVRIRKEGSAVITVTASANGYTDKDGKSYVDATKDFTLYVDAKGSGTGGTTSSGELTLEGGATAAAPVTTPAATAAELIAGDSRYSNFELKGNFTLDGMLFRVSRNFSVGNAFAIVPEKPDGDWWKTPNSFTGSRGIYSAVSAGVAPLIYADTKGKQYIININSYKMQKALEFMIPEKIPVGALFGITPPVSTAGRWFKDPAFLLGNSGTYIPLKAGSTRVTFESEGKRYHIILDITPDSDALAIADGDADSSTAGTSSVEPIILG